MYINRTYAYTKLETEDDIIKGRTSDEAIVNDIGKALKNYDLPYLGEEISTSRFKT